MGNLPYAGTLPGEFLVNSSGEACYAIPIQVPPGRAGIAPALSLAYQSNGPHDLLGVGFSLQGLSQIMRVGATPDPDGRRGAVRFDPEDRFALDGQRLVPISGNYTDPDAVFHTELERWEKIEPRYGTTTGRSGPDSFIVHEKTGRIREYGTTPDARLEAGAGNPSIYTWALSRVSDRFGNYMTIHYQPGQRALYPVSIKYTGNNGSMEPQREVRFTYEPRTDVITRYVGGYCFTIDQRLSRIETFVKGKQVLTYRLTYAEGLATKRSRLTAVTLADRQGRELPPTTFAWQDSQRNDLAETTHTNTLPDLLYGSDFLPADVDGDGHIELVSASTGPDQQLELRLYRSIPDGTGLLAAGQPCRTGLPAGGRLLPMDVDGDGRTELVYATETPQGYLALALMSYHVDARGTWTLTSRALQLDPPVLWSPDLYPADINGDGKIDLILRQASRLGTCFQVLTSQGAGFSPGKVTETELPEGGICLPLDFDGDGQTDLLYAYAAPAGNLQLALLHSNGRELKPPAGPAGQLLPKNADLPFGGTLLPMDVNGDGISDLVYAAAVKVNGKDQTPQERLRLTVLLGTGKGYLPAPSQDPIDIDHGCRLVPAQLHGNGLTDLVVVGEKPGNQGELRFLHATALVKRAGAQPEPGSGFELATLSRSPKNLCTGCPVIPLDLNGLGRSDLLYVSASPDQQAVVNIIPAQGDYPDLLTSITNGAGGRFEIAYGPMTDLAVHSRGLAANSPSPSGMDVRFAMSSRVTGAVYPVAPAGTAELQAGSAGATSATMPAAFPRYVITAYSKVYRPGQAYQYRYHYTDARMDVAGGRGWLGFASHAVTDVQAEAGSHAEEGTVTTTEFHQRFPLTHMVAGSTIRRAKDNAALCRNEFSYAEAQPPRYAGVHQVMLVKTDQKLYTGGIPNTGHTRTTQYDGFGNPVVIADAGEKRLGPDEKPLEGDVRNGPPVYTLSAYSNDERTWLIGLQTRIARSSDPAGATILNDERMEYDPKTGAMVAHMVWDDQKKQWLTTRHKYSALGNRVAETTPAEATTTFHYADPEQMMVTAVTSPPTGASGEQLTTSFDHDPAFGIWLKKTDPNGLTLEQRLDGLGRVTETWGPGPAGRPVLLSTQSWRNDTGGYRKEVRTRVDWSEGRWQGQDDYLDGHERCDCSISTDAGGVARIVVERQLSSKNQVLRESLPHFRGEQAVWVVHSYDGASRLVKTERPAAEGATTITQFAYPDVNTCVQTEAAGTNLARTTTFGYGTYDGERRPVRVEDATGDISTFEYDALGRQTGMTDAAGVQTRFALDSQDRTTLIEVRKGGRCIRREQTEFDDLKLTVKTTDNAQQWVQVFYDPLGRVTAQLDDKGNRTVLRYDSGASNSKGRVTEIRLPSGDGYQFAYDAYGNQTETAVRLDGSTYPFKRSHLPDGRVWQQIFPDGAVETFTFTAGGMLDTVALSAVLPAAAPLASAAYREYSPYGTPALIKYGNGVQERLLFSPLDQLLRQVVSPPSGEALVDSSFQWDLLDNLVRIEEARAESGLAFRYDLQGRLVEATGPWGRQDYRYQAGNMVQKADIQLAYDGNQLTRATKRNETIFLGEYDQNGNLRANLATGAQAAYAYDSAGRLVRAPGCRFAYDHVGRRLTKQVDAGPTTYYVAPDYEVVVLPDGSRQHTKYLSGQSGLVATVTAVDQGHGAGPQAYPGLPVQGVSYVLQNHVDHATLVTGAKGEVIARFAYLPFGELASSQGPDTIRTKFSDRELDLETGFYYFGARYYDPVLSRFITPDNQLGGALGQQDVLNPYAYALHNPIRYVDPTGHNVFTWAWAHASSPFSIAAVAVAYGAKKAAKATADFFASDVGQYTAAFVVDGLLIVGGVAALGATPVLGPAATVLGSTMIGAGVGGLAYGLSHSPGDFHWGDWVIQVGIGAAIGLVTSGMGEAAGVAMGAKSMALGSAGRIGVLAAKGFIGGAFGGLTGQLLQNAAAGRSAFQGAGRATLEGAAFGAAGEAGGGLMERSRWVTRSPRVLEIAKRWDAGRRTPETLLSPVVREGLWAKGLKGAPGALSGAARGALDKWGPQWSF